MVVEEEKKIAAENQGSKSQNEAYMAKDDGKDKRQMTCEH